MAGTTALKRRIGSVKNTKQITKAMELVAASKMRRAQENAIKSREYRNLARGILARIAELTDVTQHALYAVREPKAHMYLLITSDRGLAGAYNSNIYREAVARFNEDRDQNIQIQAIVIGKQGAKFLSKFKDIDIMAAYEHLPDQPSANDIRPILDNVVNLYTKKKVDVVSVIYTDYRSSISQVVAVDTILPAALSQTHVPKDLEKAEFEPSVESVLENITERIIEVQLSQAMLESKASEESMRMMAMKNASDNAGDIIDDLTLAFNTARQAAITQELAEITGGAEAIK